MKYLLDKFFIKQPRFRRFVTTLLEGNKNLKVNMFGASFHVHSIKEHGYLRASRLISRSSLLEDELPVLMALTTLLRPGDTFIDVGANVGIYSLSLARTRSLSGCQHFYAFEANPDTFTRLKAGADAFGVTVFNLAASDKHGFLEFVGGAVSHVFTTTDNQNSYSIPGETITVPCRRLDEMDLEGTSMVIKIDVEGHEREVLEGSRKLFETSRVKAVYCDGYKDESVNKFLTEYGFTLFDGRTLEPPTGHVFSLLAVKAK